MPINLAMRSYALLLFAALSLAGCIFAVTDTRSNGLGQFVPHASSLVMSTRPVASVPLVEHHDAIDLTSVLHTAISIPQRIESLERAVIVCGIILAIVGVANAALLMRLLVSRVRVPSAVPTAVSGAVAFCACGATISARTKTGRCRPCALDHRVKKRATETSALPVPSADQRREEDYQPVMPRSSEGRAGKSIALRSRV